MDNTKSPPSIITEKEFEKQEKDNIKKQREWDEGKRKEGHLWLDKGITQQMSDDMIKKYGANNWYDWSNNNWGTKWGDCDLDIDDGTIKYESAWSPISDEILKMFMKDFPSFHYHYEEEQGWGGELDIEDGKVVDQCEYDIPDWEEEIEYKDTCITKLISDHPNYEDGVGYYLEYGMEFMGKTLKDAKEYVDEDETETITDCDVFDKVRKRHEKI
jgi:hypothetical protein